MTKPMKFITPLILLVVISLAAGQGQAYSPVLDVFCRFGIGAPKGVSGYDLATLGVGSYLDWSAVRGPQVPQGIRYFHVLRVSDRSYDQTLIKLPGLLQQYPGAVWIIGNEPDSEVAFQDNISPATYAARYYQLASLIGNDDQAVRVFGTVIQPTPIRQRYLWETLNKLDELTGSPEKTRALIDVVSIHNFILNEEPIYQDGIAVNWGAGLPRGYVAGDWPEPDVIQIGGENDETSKTHDPDTFARRIEEFRAWMVENDLNDKPLWVTEYGSLFPSVGNVYLTVSESDTADFLKQTMDFLLSARDETTGYAADDYRLVQHFVWYSLNEDRWRFGGSLYDPDNQTLTMVGERYINYDPPLSSGLVPKPADLTIIPGSLTIAPIGQGSAPGLVNFRVTLRAANLTASEFRTQARAKLMINGVTVAEPNLTLPRCGGQGVLQFTFNDQLPGNQLNLAAEVTLTGSSWPDTNLDNNNHTFASVTLPPMFQNFLPLLNKTP